MILFRAPSLVSLFVNFLLLVSMKMVMCRSLLMVLVIFISMLNLKIKYRFIRSEETWERCALFLFLPL